MESLLEVNDHELIYYIHEGNEKALKLFIEKYDIIIYSEIKKLTFIWRSDKKNDLLQEGRILLIHCLQVYNPIENPSFYYYFYKSLRRKFYRLLQNDYYYRNYILMEDIDKSGVSCSGKKFDFLFNDYLEKLMFDEIFDKGFTIKSFCEKYNISFYKAKKIYNQIKAKIIDYVGL